MITKKTFIITSSFLITAALLSQVYSFSKTNVQPKSINYSAFIGLAQNVSSIASGTSDHTNIPENEVITNDIIKVIDKEITKKISRARYSIRSIKTPTKEAKKVIAKIVAPVIIATPVIAAEDLSAYELNNSDLIKLYALSVEEMAFMKFEASKLATTYNKEIKKEIKKEIRDEVAVVQASAIPAPIEADEVTTTQPAPERQSVSATTNNEAIVEEVAEETSETPKKDDEEMVMFDYSDKQVATPVAKTINQKLYERPISKTVQQAISREIGSASGKKLTPMNSQKVLPETKRQNLTRVENQDIDLNAEENITYDYSQKNSQTTQTEALTAIAEANAFTAPAKTEESQFTLRAKEINLSTQKRRQAFSFEFVPDYDRAERSDDQGSGEIALGYSLSGEMNTQTGVVQAQGMISTRVELNLGGKANFEVPLINEDGMQKFLQKQGLAIEGNLIMLTLDPAILDTEIDSTFAERFFFDKNFKNLSTASGAKFVMYAGVKIGNIMVRYLLSNKESAQKIIYVGEGEMYFEDARFTDSNRETYTLTTRNLLGQKRKELVIDASAISFFNTNIVAKKKALNAYEIKVPTLTTGMRKYLEFKHLKDTIFVGTSIEKEIEIPGNDFIAKVLEMNQVSSLKDRCVVQINLSKDIREIKANGKNRSGEMLVETSFLDKDGNFSRDSEMSEKVFVVGDQEGQFNIRMDYIDGSTEFLKTFCSEGSYLVEQL